MTRSELIKSMNRLMGHMPGTEACDGCGREHNCWDLGCAIIRAAVEELEKMQWRPAKEPPEEGQFCWVHTRHREILALIYEWYDSDGDEYNTFSSFEVTHWMPLPELPDELREAGS